VEGIDPNPSPEEKIRNPDPGVYGIESKSFETMLNPVQGIVRAVAFVVSISRMIFKLHVSNASERRYLLIYYAKIMFLSQSKTS